jgi:hypothetical protein
MLAVKKTTLKLVASHDRNDWNVMLELPAFTSSVTALDQDGLIGYLTVPEKHGDGAGGHARSYIVCPRCKDDRATSSEHDASCISA